MSSVEPQSVEKAGFSLLALRFGRTELGCSEIRTHSLVLTRQQRNLLMIIAPSLRGGDWIVRVDGSTKEDIGRLLDLLLIQEVAFSEASEIKHPIHLNEILATLSLDDLYSALVKESKYRLGFITGFRFVLKIENCADLNEMRQIATLIFETIRHKEGDDAAERFCKALAQSKTNQSLASKSPKEHKSNSLAK